MKKTILLSSICIICAFITFNSCKKKVEVDNETQTVVDNAICEQQFMGVVPTVSSKGSGSPKSQGFRVNSCGSGIWLAPNDTAYNTTTGAYTFSVAPTFTIDYTANTCADKDGVMKNGKMYITSSHKWSVVDSLPQNVTHTTTIVFDNYTADGVKYDGTIKLIKTGNAVRTIVTNGHCSTAGWNIYYNADKTAEIQQDRSVKVWGVSGGTNRDGRTFTTSIDQSNPIIKKIDCKWISSGSIEVTPDGFKTRTVNFGTGGCDDDADYTVNGQTIAFKLK